MGIENRLLVARGRGRVWAKLVKGVKRYIQSSNYKISPGDVMYSMVTLVNNNVLYI